jgi:deoxyribonuclease (pyrimidine dimer)
MTRINLIPASLLTDQHLLAEKKEINQLAGQLQKSLRSPNFDYNKLPKHFTLGTGHVRYFYRLGSFIRKRYREVHDECVFRGFSVQDNFNDQWESLGPRFNMSVSFDTASKKISTDRILERVNAKRHFYRYKGEKIDDSYFDMISEYLNGGL